MNVSFNNFRGKLYAILLLPPLDKNIIFLFVFNCINLFAFVVNYSFQKSKKTHRWFCLINFHRRIMKIA